MQAWTSWLDALLGAPMRAFLIVLPAVVVFVLALKFASALALYWVVSNCFTAAQTAAVHYVVGRRIRSGALTI